MKVNAIEGNQRRHSVFVPIIEGATVGTAAGYVGKYLLPLTKEEKNTDEYIKISNKIVNEKNKFNFRTEKVIASMKSKTGRTPAEDAFIGLFEGLKEGDCVKKGSIRNTINHLEKNHPNQVVAFKQLCKKTFGVAEETAKQCMQAYDLVTKHIRPTGVFLIAGAIVGGFAALAHNILKTEIRPSYRQE